MRPSLPLLGLLASTAAIAQSPVIGTAQFFQTGLSYLRDNYDPPAAFLDGLVAAGGPDYALDLSPVSLMFNYGTDEVIRGPGLDQYAFFPEYYDTANVRISVYQGEQGFGTFLFLRDEQGIRHVGGQPNGVTWPNESMVMRYPGNGFPLELRDSVVFGFQHTDAIEGAWSDASGSDDHYVSGTCTIEADGYGTITMPDGAVVPHTLRVRTAIAYTDSNALFGVTDRQDTIYTWYAEGVSGPLMTLLRGYYALTGGYVSPFPLAVYHPPGISAIPTVPGPMEWTIAPNPTSGPLKILFGKDPDHGVLSVVDDTGRSVRRWKVTTATVHIDVSDLTTGHYRLVLQDTAGRSVRAFHILR